MTYLDGIDGSTFDPAEYLAQFPIELLQSSAGRRALCKLDPMLFSVIYFGDHLRAGDNHDGDITFSNFHLDVCRVARQWADSGPHRDAFVAPRGGGKSTWSFLILPMWALSMGHRKYVAAFADSGPQAEQHLISFKRELDNNALLRLDFPELVKPAVRLSGVTVSDNRNLYIAHNGCVFQAKGIDSSTLGAKVGNQRPDLILFDDIEPDESNYSDYQKDKRAHSMISSVLPMNLNAAVVVSGTVTMPGSVVHDLVRTILQPDGEWKTHLRGRPDITEEQFVVHYYPALFEVDGEKRSVWPQKWTVVFLESICHTRAFQLNFMNNPRGIEGNYWQEEDFHYESLDNATRWILQIDPAVTTKGTSDYTGLAVVAFQPPSKSHPRGRCEVVYATDVKLVGEAFRDRVLQILEWFPQISRIRVEANQGGEMWVGPVPDVPKDKTPPFVIPSRGTALFGVPVPVQIQNSTIPKETRIAMGLSWYQRPGRHVVHRERFHRAEEQMLTYGPKAPNDDIVDAVCLAILYFLKDERGKITVGKKRSFSYA